MAMVISDVIEDAIEEFRILRGREPTRLRLAWCEAIVPIPLNAKSARESMT